MDRDSGLSAVGNSKVETSVETNSPRDQRRLDKIQQIIDAASEVFLQEGYSGASMDRIVEVAGVSKRTLYNYYKSKDEIFIDVMQKQLGSIYINFEPGRLASMTLADQLKHLATQILLLTNAPETLALMRNIGAETQRFPTLARHFLEESLDKVINSMAEIFEREADKAGLQIDDTHEAAEHFLDLVTGSVYHRIVFGTVPPMDDEKIKRRAEQAVDYFFRSFQR